jgi:uncharacterized coiled-coil protein SlyX
MSCLFTCLLFAIGGALASGILVDLKWKDAAKKLIDRISSLESGLSIKQSEINNLNSKLIAANSRINMLDVSLCAKDKELSELSKTAKQSEKTETNPNVTPVNPQQGLSKKRGPYKKKKNYGRPASNNNSAKKTE